MITAKQLWNDYFRRIAKISISPKVKKAVFIILSLIMLLGLMRACSSYFFIEIPVYRVAMDKTWYPLQLFDKERNMQAFANELLVAIAKQENIRMNVFVVGPDSLFMGLNNGQFDGVLSSLKADARNRESYLFSDPFYKLGAVLVVRESTDVKSLEDMHGKIIGIRTDTSLVFNIEQYPEIILKSYDNPLMGLLDLEKNIIDGVILNALSANIYTSGLFAKRLKIVGAPLTDISLRLIAKHNNEKLIEHYNSGLKILKANGTYNQLVNKWGLYNAELR